jgi:hypothetical protein
VHRLKALLGSFNPLVRAQKWYKNVKLRDKLLFGLLIIAFFATVSWVLTPAGPIPGALMGTGFAAIFHAMFTWFEWIKAGFVWIVHLIFIPIISALYASVTASDEEYIWVYIQSVAILVVSSIIITLLASRLAKGKLWVTLAIIFSGMFILGIAALLAVANAYVALLAGVVGGFLLLMLRAHFPRSKNVNFNQVTDTEKARLMSVLAENKFISTDITSKYSDNLDTILSVDPKGYLTVTKIVKLDQGLSYDEKSGVSYQKTNISSWVAQNILESQFALGKNVPFSLFFAFQGDPYLNITKYQPLGVNSKMGANVGVVGLISTKHIIDGFNAWFKDASPQKVTKDQIRKVNERLLKR